MFWYNYINGRLTEKQTLKRENGRGEFIIYQEERGEGWGGGGVIREYSIYIYIFCMVLLGFRGFFSTKQPLLYINQLTSSYS